MTKPVRRPHSEENQWPADAGMAASRSHLRVCWEPSCKTVIPIEDDATRCRVHREPRPAETPEGFMARVCAAMEWRRWRP